MVEAKTEIDQGDFRKVLGLFATGIVIVTTGTPERGLRGLTVSSFNSVSLTPPLILWSIGLTSPSLPAFRENGRFAVNVLAHDQTALCRQFSSAAEDKFLNVDLIENDHGVPIISGSAAHMICNTYARYPGGDHEIVVGEVIAMQGFSREPLLFHAGKLRTLLPLS